MPVMVGCPQCSKTISPSATECPYCGATQSVQSTQTKALPKLARFEVSLVPNAGFVRRLFGRAPRENAFIEVRNLLATTPWHEVRESDVATVLARHKLTSHDAFKELCAIYRDAVAVVAADRDISPVESAGLDRMKACFDLADSDAHNIALEAARDLYRETLVNSLADGSITSEERATLERICRNLQLDAATAEQIYAEEATNAIQMYFNHAISDGRYSPDEERRLHQMAETLGVSFRFDEKTQRLVDRLRLLGRIDAGDLPIVSVPILLTRGEVCHFAAENISQREMRTVTKRVNYSGFTNSVRIVGNLRWRVGSIRSERVTRDVLAEVDSGSVFVTSKKLLIQGVRRKTSVSLGKIIHFTVYNDGLQVQKDSGKDIWLLGAADWQLAGACLDAAARHVR